MSLDLLSTLKFFSKLCIFKINLYAICALILKFIEIIFETANCLFRKIAMNHCSISKNKKF